MRAKPFRKTIEMTSPLDQKIKITGPVVVTANRVADGAVVYLRADGSWSTALDDAVITSEIGAARDMIGVAIADDLRAVGPYIAPVKLTGDGEVRPGNLRELIRRAGPTITLPSTGDVERMIAKTGCQAAY